MVYLQGMVFFIIVYLQVNGMVFFLFMVYLQVNGMVFFIYGIFTGK